jgi:hypothetical protein
MRQYIVGHEDSTLKTRCLCVASGFHPRRPLSKSSQYKHFTGRAEINDEPSGIPE